MLRDGVEDVAWGDTDPLARVLTDLQLAGTFYCATELGAPWALDVPARRFASFHVVTDGACWLHRRGEAPLALAAGDLVFLAGSPPHRLAHGDRVRAGATVARLAAEAPATAASAAQLGGRGARTHLVCGGVRLRGHVATTLATLVPPVLALRRARAVPIVAAALDAMADEARSARPGSATLMNRLADVVILHAIRAWLESADTPRRGWLAALRDPRLGPVIAAVHERPGDDWTLPALARAAHMSRSTFAERFTELAGASPVQYVSAVRMAHARELLEREPLSIAEVAGRVGYDSESAFARAFKRHSGHAPGATRRPAAPTAGPRAAGGRRRWPPHPRA